jgi:hypothetical protein
MKQTTKNSFSWWLFTILKIITALVTAYDTFRVSQSYGYPVLVSLLHMAVLDVAFLAFWWRAGEGGTAEDALPDRRNNLIFAIGIYATMLWIGWDSAHALAIGVRSVGIIALSRDGYDIYRALRKLSQEKREKELLDTDRQRQLVKARMIHFAQGWARWVLQPAMVKRVVDDMRKEMETPAIVVEGASRPAPRQLDALDRKVLAAYTGNPLLSTRDAAKLASTTHTTVNNRLAKLERDGVIYRNGHGVEIVE